MINWRNVWVGVILGSCIVLAMGMTDEVREPQTWNCYKTGQMTSIPPNMEVVRCQAHYPRNADGKRHIFCHLREIS